MIDVLALSSEIWSLGADNIEGPFRVRYAGVAQPNIHKIVCKSSSGLICSLSEAVFNHKHGLYILLSEIGLGSRCLCIESLFLLSYSAGELVNDCSVYRSGQLQFLRFQQLPDGPEGVYLRINVDPESGRNEKISLALIVSPYDLLRFAHQILDELDPLDSVFHLRD